MGGSLGQRRTQKSSHLTQKVGMLQVRGFMSPTMQAVVKKCRPQLLANTPPGRSFASCIALGRNFSVTFRKAPPVHAQLHPLRPQAEEWSRARAGGGSKGYAEIHTQGDARREASPSWGVCHGLAHFITTAFWPREPPQLFPVLPSANIL